MNRSLLGLVLLAAWPVAAASRTAELKLTGVPLKTALAHLGEQVPDLEYVALAQPDEPADLALAGPLPEVMPKLAAAYRLQAVACGDLWVLGSAPAPEQAVSAYLAALPEPEASLAREMIEGDAKTSLADRVRAHLARWQQEAVTALRARWHAPPVPPDGPAWMPLALTEDEARLIRRGVAAIDVTLAVETLSSLRSPVNWSALRARRSGPTMSVQFGITQPDGRVGWLTCGSALDREPVTAADPAFRLAWLPDRMESPWRGTSDLNRSVTLRADGPPAVVATALSQQAGVATDLSVGETRATWQVRVAERPLWQVFDAFTIASGRLWGPLVDAPEHRLMAPQEAQATLYPALPLPERLAALLCLHRSPRVVGPVIWSALDEAQRQTLAKGEELPFAQLSDEQKALLNRVGGPLLTTWPLFDQYWHMGVLHQPGAPAAAWAFAGTAVNCYVACGRGSVSFPVIDGDAESRQRLAGVVCPTGLQPTWTNQTPKADGFRSLGEPRRAAAPAPG